MSRSSLSALAAAVEPTRVELNAFCSRVSAQALAARTLRKALALGFEDGEVFSTAEIDVTSSSDFGNLLRFVHNGRTELAGVAHNIRQRA